MRLWKSSSRSKQPLGVGGAQFCKMSGIETIPESFANLTKLKILHMFECEALEEFPFGVGNLLALEELSFAACRALKRIP